MTATQRSLIDQLEKDYAAAADRCKKTKKLARVHSGMYLGLVGDTVWQFRRHYRDDNMNPNNMGWIAETYNTSRCNADYSDSYDTLAELKVSMGVD